MLKQLRNRDPRSRIAIEATFHHFVNVDIRAARKRNRMLVIRNRMQLLDERQSGEGCRAINHLVEDAAERPDVRRAAELVFPLRS